MLKKLGWGLAAPAAAFVMAITITSIALIVSGHNPLEAYSELIGYGTSTIGLIGTLNLATPLYLSGLAAAIGFRMNLFNIGVDGQYRLGAFAAAALGASIAPSAPIGVTLNILMAVAIGAAWAGLAGWLNVRRNVNVVVSTIMLNYVATAIISYLLLTYFRNPGAQIVQTKPIPASGVFPTLNWLLEAFGVDVPPNVFLSGFIVIAATTGVAFYLLVWRTRFGYDLRASGVNPFAARAAGVDPKRMVIYTMLISGGIAGLVGAAALLGDRNNFSRYSINGFPLGYGFNGIAVALVGQRHPVGAAIAALLFAGLDISAQALPNVGIPPRSPRS
jgi:general nucleoside transport system permease protein